MRGKIARNGRKARMDERKSVRSPLLVLEVKGKHYNKIFIGYAKNISKDGLFLDARQSLKPGDQFPVEFVLPDGATKITCICEVVWTKQYSRASGGSRGMGVRFVKMAPSQKRIIEEWVLRTEGGSKSGRGARKTALSEG